MDRDMNLGVEDPGMTMGFPLPEQREGVSFAMAGGLEGSFETDD